MPKWYGLQGLIIIIAACLQRMHGIECSAAKHRAHRDDGIINKSTRWPSASATTGAWQLSGRAVCGSQHTMPQYGILKSAEQQDMPTTSDTNIPHCTSCCCTYCSASNNKNAGRIIIIMLPIA
jgi:hypothetical protein